MPDHSEPVKEYLHELEEHAKQRAESGKDEAEGKAAWKNLHMSLCEKRCSAYVDGNKETWLRRHFLAGAAAKSGIFVSVVQVSLNARAGGLQFYLILN